MLKLVRGFYLENCGYLYLENSVDICISNLVWKRCLEVSVGRSRVGKASEDAVKPSVREDPPRSRRERERSGPGRAPLHAPRSSGIGGNCFAGDTEG